jgi:hypothetical protein
MKIFQSMVGKEKEKENKKKIESSWYNLPLAHILKESTNLYALCGDRQRITAGHQHMHK